MLGYIYVKGINLKGVYKICIKKIGRRKKTKKCGRRMIKLLHEIHFSPHTNFPFFVLTRLYTV